MRIVVHHRTQGQGVEGVHLLGMAHGFERIGCEVILVSPPGVTLGQAGAAHAKGTGLRGLWYVLAERAPEFLFELLEIAYNVPAYFRLRRAIRERGASLLYERYAFFNVAGAWAARAAGIPFVLEANYVVETPLFRARSRLLRPLARAFERFVFRRADRIAAVSSPLQRQIVASGIPGDRVLLVPNAADPRRFVPRPDEGAAVRATLGLEGMKVIGFSGAFFPWHGVDLILDALPRVLARIPEAAVLLLGDGPERPRLEERVRREGWEARVRFGGWIGHDRLPDHVAAFDVAVMPDSNDYGSPMKIYEYMAMGKPVVAPRLGPLADGIEDGATGILFAPRDVAAFADALIRVLGEDETRRAMGSRAAAHVLANHTWERNAARILNGLVERPSGGVLDSYSP